MLLPEAAANRAKVKGKTLRRRHCMLSPCFVVATHKPATGLALWIELFLLLLSALLEAHRSMKFSVQCQLGRCFAVMLKHSVLHS